MFLGTKIGHQKEEQNSSQKISLNAPATACALHNFPECFFVLSTALGNLKVGLLLACTMMAHNIPLGISLALVGGKLTLKERLKYIIIAGIIPASAVISVYLCLRQYITAEIIQQIFPFAGGCLTCIALSHLIPFAYHHGSVKSLFAGLLIGIIIMIIALILIV